MSDQIALVLQHSTRACLALLLLATLAVLIPAPVSAALTPASLRCEHRVDPLGIDVTAPRLGWIVESPDRGARQTAYRILVASDPALLDADTGDLWDTGKVASDNTVDIVYTGAALPSRRECFWKVRVWDETDTASAWSAPAYWSMGLLAPGDWSAQWIGVDNPVFPSNPAQTPAPTATPTWSPTAGPSPTPTRTPTITPTPSPTPTATPGPPASLNFDGCTWIWNAGDNPPPGGTRYFRGIVTIPAGTTILQAWWLITVDDQFTGWVNGVQVTQSDGNIDAWTRPRMVAVANLATGDNVLAVQGSNSALGPAGVLGKLVVTTTSGELIYRTDTSWKGAASFSTGWMNPGFDDTGWANAVSWGLYPTAPWYSLSLAPAGVPAAMAGSPDGAAGASRGLVYRYNPREDAKKKAEEGAVPKIAVTLPPPTHLRREFAVNKTVKRATLYATALGIYEAYLNGGKVGDAWLAPGWTSYHKRVLYQTCDVTHLIEQGNNALGAILADGWFAGYTGLARNDGVQRDYYRVDHGMPERRFRAQLEIEYTDGSMDTIATNNTWKGAKGPRDTADIMYGETYDARDELTGWTVASYDDSTWQGVNVTASVNTLVRAHPGEPIRALREFPALSVNQPVSGKWIFNLGQNFAGVVRLRVNLPAGTVLTLRHGERIYGDGTLNADNLKWAAATDTYICKGGGEEVWHPRFTYHGFQYVELSGYPGTPPASAVTGIALGSDIAPTGSFTCPNSMVNQLVSNIYWTQRSNYMDIPTDCPQRAERLGWLGDAHIFVRTAAYNADVQSFFTKWIADMNDSRNGALYRDFAPHFDRQGAGNGAWAEAGVAVPWAMYQAYGDVRVLEEWFDEMAAFVDAYAAGAPTFIRGGVGYGDWVDPDPNKDTPHEVIHTAYFAYAAALVRDMAEVLNRPADVSKYDTLFHNIKNAFNNAYVGGDGRIHGDTQTAYIMALQFDLLDEPVRTMAVNHLVNDIQGRGNHLSTGFVGTKDLMPVLTEIGRTDVAYDLLLQTSYPSWLDIVNQGATTTWEYWNSWYGQSFSHYTFGCVGEWLYRTVGGIDMLEPGYATLRIKPEPGGGFGWAEASFDSIRGTIQTHWAIDGDYFDLDVTIPANTTAEVYLPSCNPLYVAEGGLPVSQVPEVTFLRTEGNYAVYEVQSGNYSFRSRTNNCGTAPRANWSAF